MVAAITSWAKTIIIAVIIGAIIEMILPENKNKKYVKVVIGIYILFCIINPVIGKNIDLNEYNIEKYINLQSNNSNESTSTINVDKVYKDKVISNIKAKIQAEGYDSDNINITNNESYNITSIAISNIYEYKKKSDVNINKIEINIKDKTTKGIANSQKTKLIKILSETYGITEEKITIN